MTIAITAATGQLGQLVVEDLLKRVPAEQLVLVVRSPEKAAAFADRGVKVRKAAYDDKDALVGAFTGVDKVLLISGSEVGRRVPQHTAVVEAAAQNSVSHIVYTSAPHADDTPLILAPEHKATEELIRASGIPYTLLRNGWYTENYAQLVAQAASEGSFVTSAGDGRVASAARGDYALAAAVVLTSDGHENKTYELTGDTAWTFDEFAEAIAQITGNEVKVTHLTPAQHQEALRGAGLPDEVASFVVALDANIAEGTLAHTPGELSRLIGRPTTSIAETIATLLPI
jgi:NAD(P)H dehydrogenase (quinone)